MKEQIYTRTLTPWNKIRLEKGLTLQQIANEIGVKGAGVISYWFNGKMPIPDDRFKKICDILEIDYDEGRKFREQVSNTHFTGKLNDRKAIKINDIPEETAMPTEEIREENGKVIIPTLFDTTVDILRRRHSYTYLDLAKKCKTSSQVVYGWCEGVRYNISFINRILLLDAFGLDSSPDGETWKKFDMALKNDCKRFYMKEFGKRDLSYREWILAHDDLITDKSPETRTIDPSPYAEGVIKAWEFPSDEEKSFGFDPDTKDNTSEEPEEPMFNRAVVEYTKGEPTVIEKEVKPEKEKVCEKWTYNQAIDDILDLTYGKVTRQAYIRLENILRRYWEV